MNRSTMERCSPSAGAPGRTPIHHPNANRTAIVAAHGARRTHLRRERRGLPNVGQRRGTRVPAAPSAAGPSPADSSCSRIAKALVRSAAGAWVLEGCTSSAEALTADAEIDSRSRAPPPASTRPEGGRVSLQVRDANDRVIVEIADDGPGMNGDAPSGEGFGLHSVRERVRAAGPPHELVIESNRTQGTRVRITLPKTPASSPSPTTRSTHPGATP
jgi:hypothetical protein